ncbi:MAG: flagellar hook-length control protein FliK [Paracoccaceae bacterium]
MPNNVDVELPSSQIANSIGLKSEKYLPDAAGAEAKQGRGPELLPENPLPASEIDIEAKPTSSAPIEGLMSRLGRHDLVQAARRGENADNLDSKTHASSSKLEHQATFKSTNASTVMPQSVEAGHLSKTKDALVQDVAETTSVKDANTQFAKGLSSELVPAQTAQKSTLTPDQLRSATEKNAENRFEKVAQQDLIMEAEIHTLQQQRHMSQPNVAQPLPVANAVPQAVQVTNLQVASRDRNASSDIEVETMNFDMRNGTSSSTQAAVPSQATSTLFQPQMIKNIALQLQDGLRNMSDRSVEISLSPQELGRIRLSLATTEGGIVLQVTAERQETLDLMKRNASELAKDLQSLGFDMVDLAFGQGGQDQQAFNESSSDVDIFGQVEKTDVLVIDEAVAQTPNSALATTSSGLDIRI